ncbi:MAG: ribosomal protein S18-alanine N-acetyltransferase [Natrialbaceae archaeon]|nr:ribosomal protein S18-alanine N-acetyltransferase [Natrialbaceae archaeon]
MTTTARPISIRPVSRADLLEIVKIERASFPQPWPYRAFETYLDEPAFLVADSNGEIVGYIVADVTRQYGRPVGHVKDIAVRDEVRRSGIGAALLERAMNILDSHGAGAVMLEVRPSNEAARRLYHSYGFERDHRVDGYYDDEDAIVLVRRLG